MGSSGMKRKGRRHLRKLRGHDSRRGGGVTHFDSTPWGPMNVNDGGRDAPGRPPTPRTRIVVSALLALLMVGAVVVVALTLSG